MFRKPWNPLGLQTSLRSCQSFSLADLYFGQVMANDQHTAVPTMLLRAPTPEMQALPRRTSLVLSEGQALRRRTSLVLSRFAVGTRAQGEMHCHEKVLPMTS